MTTPNNTREILDAFYKLSGQSVPQTSELPANYAEVADNKTADTPENRHDMRVGLSVLASVSYRSPQGNDKKRDLLIRRIIKTKTDLYIDGLAMDIRAPRLVKVSDISQIHDMGSGRVYNNPYQFLQERLGFQVSDEVLPKKMDEIAKVIDRMHNEIAVLMYVVAIDGVRHKDERSVVAKYVRSQTADLNYSDQDLDEYLISIAPDAESAGMAFQRILLKDKSVIQSFVETLINVIMADGEAGDKERVFLAKVMTLLESRGFQFDLGL